MTIIRSLRDLFPITILKVICGTVLFCTTCGAYMAHTKDLIAEQLREEDTAHISIAFAALLDDATVVTLQYAVPPKRIHLSSVKGLFLNIPNDIFNGRKRTYLQDPDGKWLTVDNRLGVSSIYGDGIQVHDTGCRQVVIHRRCPYPERSMLHADEIVTKLQLKPQWYAKGETIFDFGTAVVCMPDPDHRVMAEQVNIGGELTRAVRIRGADNNLYIVVANFADNHQICEIPGIDTVELDAHDCVILKL